MTYNILYIEDNPDNMRLIQKVPEAQGYEVHDTANMFKGDAEKAQNAGGDTYLPKPVNIRELYTRVEKYLSGNGE